MAQADIRREIPGHVVRLPKTTSPPRKPRSAAIAALLFVVSGLLYGIPFASADPSGIVSDDFSDPVLDPRWTVVDPVGDATVSMTGTSAHVSLPGGTAHDISTGANKTVRLLQDAPNTNFVVDARFDNPVGPVTSAEGIIIQQDDDDFIWFEASSIGCQARLIAGVSTGGTLKTAYNKTTNNGMPQYLRIGRTGNKWSVAYSHNGLAWTTIKNFSHSLSVTMVGPYVANGGNPAPPFEADIDYFVSRGVPLEFEDGDPFEAVPDEPSIDLWHGDNQAFGSVGEPQPLTNVLGNVTDPDGISKLVYSLNGGPNQKLGIGAGGTTLHLPGDISVNTPFSGLMTGDNSIVITATDTLGNQSVEEMNLHYASGNVWPLPYDIDWSTAGDVTQVAQPVNGLWGIEGDGVRTLIPGYDRLLALGESSWDGYEVTTTVTINDDSLACKGGGVGLLLGWDGYGGKTPWGAIGWYQHATQTRWVLQLLGSKPMATDRNRVLEIGVPYVFKMQMERTSVSPVEYTYRLKVWPQGQTEPTGWDLTGAHSLGGGSIGLLSHYVDATFGDVTVVPLAP